MATNSKDTFTERNPYLVYSDEFEDTKTDIMETVGNMLEDTAITLSSEAVRAFDTVAEMRACTSLMDGMICHTNGFHASGDGGAAFYKVSSTGTANGMDVLACGDVFANLCLTDNAVNTRQLGMQQDSLNGETYIARASAIADIVYLMDDCVTSSGITINKNIELYGGGHSITVNSTDGVFVKFGSDTFKYSGSYAQTINKATSQIVDDSHIENNDIVIIGSDEYYFEDADQIASNTYTCGVLSRVSKDENNCFINTPSWYQFTSNSLKVQSSVSIVVKDIAFICNDALSASKLFNMCGCVDSIIENVTVKSANGIGACGFCLTRCTDCVIINCASYDVTTSDGTSYGFAIYGNDNVIENCVSFNSEHGFTIAGASYFSCNNVISSCISNMTNSNNYGCFDCHANAYNTVFENVTLNNPSGRYAINIRGKKTIVDNFIFNGIEDYSSSKLCRVSIYEFGDEIKILNSHLLGCVLDMSDARTRTNIIVENSSLFGICTNASTNATIKNFQIKNVSFGNATAFVTKAIKCVLTGCKLRNVQLDSCENVSITNNEIDASSTTSSTVNPVKINGNCYNVFCSNNLLVTDNRSNFNHRCIIENGTNDNLVITSNVGVVPNNTGTNSFSTITASSTKILDNNVFVVNS